MSIDKDVAAGLLFMCIGALGLFIGADYAFGTPAKMGAGFVPKLLAWGLIGIGGLIAMTGFARRADNDGMDKWAFGPLLVILAGVLVFGACLEPFGLEGATIGAILIASSGRSQQSPFQLGLLSLAIPCLLLSLFPGISRHIGQSGVMALLIAAGAALTVQWLIYIFSEEKRAIVEQLVLGLTLAVLSVIVFADFLGLPFKSLFVMQIWLPLKANIIVPIIGAVRGILR